MPSRSASAAAARDSSPDAAPCCRPRRVSSTARWFSLPTNGLPHPSTWRDEWRVATTSLSAARTRKSLPRRTASPSAPRRLSMSRQGMPLGVGSRRPCPGFAAACRSMIFPHDVNVNRPTVPGSISRPIPGRAEGGATYVGSSATNQERKELLPGDHESMAAGAVRRAVGCGCAGVRSASRRSSRRCVYDGCSGAAGRVVRTSSRTTRRSRQRSGSGNRVYSE